MTNICNYFVEHVNKVKGLGTNSASPADIWTVTLKDGYSLFGIRIKSVFMKIFADPDRRIIDEKTCEKIEALKYEAKFYESVAGFMNRGGIGGQAINPNYLTFYENISCPFNTFEKILVNSGMSTEQARNNLYRNFGIISGIYELEQRTGREYQRPAINNNGKEIKIKDNKFKNNLQVENYLKNKQYHAIITKPSSGETVSDFLYKIDKIDKKRVTTENIKNIHKLECCIVSAVTGILSMSYLKAAHNDIHLGNMFTRKLPTDEYYKIDGERGEPFSFRMRRGGLGVSIYDFDRSYFKDGYDNPFLAGYDDKRCKTYGLCNAYVFSRDIILLVCHTYRVLCEKGSPKVAEKLLRNTLKCICKTESAQKDLEKRVKKSKSTESWCSLTYGNLKTVDKNWVKKNAHPPNIILKKLVTTFINGNKYLKVINPSDCLDRCYDLTKKYTLERYERFVPKPTLSQKRIKIRLSQYKTTLTERSSKSKTDFLKRQKLERQKNYEERRDMNR